MILLAVKLSFLIAALAINILLFRLIRALYRANHWVPASIAVVCLLPLLTFSIVIPLFSIMLLVSMTVSGAGAWFLSESLPRQGSSRYFTAFLTLNLLSLLNMLVVFAGFSILQISDGDGWDLWYFGLILLMLVGPNANALACWFSLYLKKELTTGESKTPLEIEAEAALAGMDGSTRWEEHIEP